ncbi:MAG: substrate-binding domain-containing protein [Chloroflexota bacterium]|nr:substrate-binding domain-containing protein [Chloroflexota bacterium]
MSLPRISSALLAALLVALVGFVAAGCAEAARERLGLGLAPPISVAMIVHGAEGDPFWEDVRAGAEDAARAFDVNLFWRSTADAEERVRLIDEVVQQGFEVLVVTLSDPEAMSDVVRDAALIGITVYIVNVGAEIGAQLGADSYFGQVETVAGLAVGDRFAEAGGTHLLCVQHEAQNVALETRCNRAGSRLDQLTTLQVEPNSEVESQIAQALAADESIDAVLTMNTRVMNDALAALQTARGSQSGGRTVVHAVFELNEVVLDAIEDGRVAFAVDQQPYLQGYLPVAYSRLVQYSELTQGDELADALLQWIAGRGVLLGPGFVDSHNAQRVRESMQSLRTSSNASEQVTE